MVLSDVAYIRSSWRRNYRQQALSKVSVAVFDENHPALIDKLIANSNTVVACSTDEPGAIHGWACGVIDGPLHYAYVAAPLRGRGIARAVIESALGSYPARIFVTHRFFGNGRCSRFVFNPYALGMTP